MPSFCFDGGGQLHAARGCRDADLRRGAVRRPLPCGVSPVICAMSASSQSAETADGAAAARDPASIVGLCFGEPRGYGFAAHLAGRRAGKIRLGTQPPAADALEFGKAARWHVRWRRRPDRARRAWPARRRARDRTASPSRPPRRRPRRAALRSTASMSSGWILTPARGDDDFALAAEKRQFAGGLRLRQDRRWRATRPRAGEVRRPTRLRRRSWGRAPALRRRGRSSLRAREAVCRWCRGPRGRDG